MRMRAIAAGITSPEQQQVGHERCKTHESRSVEEK